MRSLKTKAAILGIAAALLAPSALAETRIVNGGDFYFQDQVTMTSHTRINVGDTVKWQWVFGNHTTTSVEKLWNAPINSITQTFSRVFDTPGVYEYYCSMDPLVMRGTVQVDGVMTHVQPIRVDVGPGHIVSGGLNEILNSDDQRMVTRPGVVLSNSADPNVVRVAALVPPGTGENTHTLRVESHASSGSILQRIRLYDHVAAVWEEVHLSLVTTTDAVREATVNDPQRFMTPATGTVRAEVAYKAIGPVLGFPWQARIDQIEWIAQ
jgi:plastocyanin